MDRIGETQLFQEPYLSKLRVCPGWESDSQPSAYMGRCATFQANHFQLSIELRLEGRVHLETNAMCQK
jgi:hypothetical protein